MKRILIADDHPAVRKALRHVFASEPEIVICGEATNGREVLEKAQELNPDLVLLDISMPVMGGMDAAEALRKSMPEVPIAMFTNYATKFSAAYAAGAGADLIVSKQGDITSLIAKVRSLLHLDRPLS